MNVANMTPSEIDRAEQREWDAQDEDARDNARDELYNRPCDRDPCSAPDGIHTWDPIWRWSDPPLDSALPWSINRCRTCGEEAPSE